MGKLEHADLAVRGSLPLLHLLSSEGLLAAIAYEALSVVEGVVELDCLAENGVMAHHTLLTDLLCIALLTHQVTVVGVEALTYERFST